MQLLLSLIKLLIYEVTTNILALKMVVKFGLEMNI